MQNLESESYNAKLFESHLLTGINSRSYGPIAIPRYNRCLWALSTSSSCLLRAIFFGWGGPSNADSCFLIPTQHLKGYICMVRGAQWLVWACGCHNISQATLPWQQTLLKFDHADRVKGSEHVPTCIPMGSGVPSIDLTSAAFLRQEEGWSYFRKCSTPAARPSWLHGSCTAQAVCSTPSCPRHIDTSWEVILAEKGCCCNT